VEIVARAGGARTGRASLEAVASGLAERLAERPGRAASRAARPSSAAE
jgi:hypothetical protein